MGPHHTFLYLDWLALALIPLILYVGWRLVRYLAAPRVDEAVAADQDLRDLARYIAEVRKGSGR